MGDTRLVWAIFAPWIAASLAVLCLQGAQRVRGSVGRWLNIAALAVLCGGLLVEGPLLVSATGDAALLGLRLVAPPVSRVGLLAANASLLCAIFIVWAGSREDSAPAFRSSWAAVGACLVSGLLAASLLVAEPLVQVLCLFAAAIAISGVAMLQVPLSYVDDDNSRTLLALRTSAALKYLAISALGTGLLVIGTLIVLRYGLSLEDRGLLQIGLAVLSVGLVMRSGAMPFSAAFPDMVRAAPGVAVIALGAGVPATITLGLMLLSPVDFNSAHASSLAWLGAVGALLAGLRALYASQQIRGAQSDSRHHILVAMSVALSLGWALFGVFSGSRLGATGASLLAVNAALAVPLLVGSGAYRATNMRLSLLGTVVGALSLLGLPPLGGFGGTLMVAQAAVNLSGVWLAALLLGSLLVAGGWLGWASHAMPDAVMPQSNLRSMLASPIALLICTLIVAQLALFFLSGHWTS